MKINEILKTLSQNSENIQTSNNTKQPQQQVNKSTTQVDSSSSSSFLKFPKSMLKEEDNLSGVMDGYGGYAAVDSTVAANSNHSLDGVRKRSRKPKHTKITKSVIEESLSNNLCELKHTIKSDYEQFDNNRDSDDMDQHSGTDGTMEEYRREYPYYENDEGSSGGGGGGEEHDDQYAEYQDEDDEHSVTNKENVDASSGGHVKKRQRKSDSPSHVDEDEMGKPRRKSTVAAIEQRQTKRRSEAEKEANENINSINNGLGGFNEKKQRSKSLMNSINLSNLSLNFPQLTRDDILKSIAAASSSSSLLSAAAAAAATAIPPAPVKRGPGRPPKYPRPSASTTSTTSSTTTSTDPLAAVQNISWNSLSSLELASLLPLLNGSNCLSSYTTPISTGPEKKESRSNKSANLNQIIDTMSNKSTSGGEDASTMSTTTTASSSEHSVVDQSKPVTTKCVKPETTSNTIKAEHTEPTTTTEAPLDQQLVSPVVNEPTAEIEQLKKAQFNTMAKLAYLNVCGQLSDSSLEFLLNEPTNKKSKKEMVTQLINYIDCNLTTQVASSPLFSLSIDVDHELTHLFVYIKFLNHEKISAAMAAAATSTTTATSSMLNIQEKRLIKLIELKPSVRNFDHPTNDIKLSKYLFEQLKVSVITHYKLNKQNLMCLSVDNRLLNRICTSTLQLYLNDLFNSFIMMVPSFSLHEPVARELNAWTCNKMSLAAFLATYQDICVFLKQNSINKELVAKMDLMTDINKSTSVTAFDFNSLNKYWTLANAVCDNYSNLIAELDTSASCPTQLNETLNSSEFYLTSWILRDLFKFLCDFVKGSKNMNSLSPFWMEWSVPNLDHYNNNNKKKVGLEYEKIRDSVETMCRRLFDLHNPEYQKLLNNYAQMTTSSSGSSDKLTTPPNKTFVMLNIYRTLYNMFDIKIKSINENNAQQRLEFTHGLEHDLLEDILEFYEFKNLIEFNVVEEQYKLFFDTYLERLSSEESDWLREQLKQNSSVHPNESIFGIRNPLSSSLKEKFVKYVYENNKKQFAPVISFMAINYLCLPPMLTLNPLTIMSKTAAEDGHNHHHQQQQMSQQQPMDDKFWSDLECRFKLLNTIKSSYAIDLDDNCGFDLTDLPLQIDETTTTTQPQASS